MGNLGSTYGDTTTYSYGNEMVWIYNTSSSGYYYRTEKKEDKDFISEKEFKV